jgi:hypothetical protein
MFESETPPVIALSGQLLDALLEFLEPLGLARARLAGSKCITSSLYRNRIILVNFDVRQRLVSTTGANASNRGRPAGCR